VANLRYAEKEQKADLKK